MIPGSNLLQMAMGPIARQSVQWSAWQSRVVNEAGDWVSTFADPVTITGSMQPVDRKLYQQLGLSLSRDYSTLWTSADVRVTDEDREGDKVLWAGAIWQAESDRDWRPADGWRKVLCVKVPS